MSIRIQKQLLINSLYRRRHQCKFIILPTNIASPFLLKLNGLWSMTTHSYPCIDIFYLRVQSYNIIYSNSIVVFVNIDSKDQHIKKKFSTNFWKVVYYDQVKSSCIPVEKQYLRLKILVPLVFFVSPNMPPHTYLLTWLNFFFPIQEDYTTIIYYF